MHKASQPAPKQRGSAAAPHLFPGIPAIEADHEFYPLKAFAVSLDLMPALGPRLFLDGHQHRLKDARGMVNCLDGPADADPFRLYLPIAKLREFLAREEGFRRTTPIALDGPGVPPSFTLGLLDIVTYPFWFMLVYPTVRDREDADELKAKHFQVNSNLLNIFYPELRRFASVLIGVFAIGSFEAADHLARRLGAGVIMLYIRLNRCKVSRVPFGCREAP